MAVEFADGVVFGADSRTSTGTYVANRVTDKLTQVFVMFVTYLLMYSSPCQVYLTLNQKLCN